MDNAFEETVNIKMKTLHLHKNKNAQGHVKEIFFHIGVLTSFFILWAHNNASFLQIRTENAKKFQDLCLIAPQLYYHFNAN